MHTAQKNEGKGVYLYVGVALFITLEKAGRKRNRWAVAGVLPEERKE